LSAERIDAENKISVNNKNKEIMYKNVMKVAVVVAIAMVAGINLLNAQKPEVLSDVVMANVEALAENETSKGECPKEGGMANKYCEIWNVSYTTSMPAGVSVTCSTGGGFKCEEGVCPHGN